MVTSNFIFSPNFCDAVYTARFMLDYDPDENEVLYSHIEEPKSLASFEVYPNPAKDKINFNFSRYTTSPMVQIALYDVMGRKIKGLSTQIEPLLQMEVGDITNGIYTFRILSDQQLIGCGKIVIYH